MEQQQTNLTVKYEKQLRSKNQQIKELEEKIEQYEQQLRTYQAVCVSHGIQTSQLYNVADVSLQTSKIQYPDVVQQSIQTSDMYQSQQLSQNKQSSMFQNNLTLTPQKKSVTFNIEDEHQTPKIQPRIKQQRIHETKIPMISSQISADMRMRLTNSNNSYTDQYMTRSKQIQLKHMQNNKTDYLSQQLEQNLQQLRAIIGKYEIHKYEVDQILQIVYNLQSDRYGLLKQALQLPRDLQKSEVELHCQTTWNDTKQQLLYQYTLDATKNCDLSRHKIKVNGKDATVASQLLFEILTGLLSGYEITRIDEILFLSKDEEIVNIM